MKLLDELAWWFRIGWVMTDACDHAPRYAADLRRWHSRIECWRHRKTGAMRVVYF